MNKLFFLLSVVFVTFVPVGAQTPSMNPIQGPSYVCSFSAAPTSFTGSAGNSPTSFQWSVLSPSTGVVIFNPGSAVTQISFPNTNSTYTLSFEANNGFGTSVIMTTVTVYETPNVTFSGANSVCLGSSTNLSASPTIISASSTLSYSWSPGIGLNSTTSGTVIANPPVSTTYTVQVMLGPCSNSIIVPVSVLAPPVVSVNSGSICAGDLFTLVPGGASTYFIYGGGGYVVSPPVNTSYSIVGVSAQGCPSSNTAVATVVVHPLPIITVNSGTVCAGQAFTIAPSGANSYTVSGGSTVVTPSLTTGYSVTGVSSVGCVSSNTPVSTVSVSSLPLPTISVVSSNTIICEGESVTLNISGSAVSYSVSSIAVPTSFTVMPMVTTTYTIQGSGSNGCIATYNFTQNTDQCLGVESRSANEKNNLTIYPNPGTEFTIEADREINLNLVNELGQVLKRVQLDESNNYRISISDLPPGIYFVVGENSSQKIIVTK